MAKKKKKLTKKTQRYSKEERMIFLEKIGATNAKSLRLKSTPQEKILYQYLKELGYKFEFQVPIIVPLRIPKLYIVDFLLDTYMIFLEVDGGQHNTKEGLRADNRRSKHLKTLGYEPLRFSNRQISTFTRNQIKQILDTKIMLNQAKNLDNSI